MSRSFTYRRIVSDVVNRNHDQALNATIFILREVGPTGFLLQEEGDSKKYKVLIGDLHSCTCQSFRKENDLCKHICWVLLRKFRIKKEDPLSWQRGMVEREINAILYNHSRFKTQHLHDNTRADVVETAQTTDSKEAEESKDSKLSQRPITADDVCPICQDELLESRLPVTFCREGCGNNVHIRCMRVWSDHQKKQKQIGPNDYISCPFCRGDFAPLALLMREVAQTHHLDGRARGTQGGDSGIHHGTECGQCRTSPISGKAYKCQTCVNYLLCATCFNASVHAQHEFIFREKSNARWKPAPAARALPGALINSLQARELSEIDYDLLLQLDAPATGSDLRQSDLDRLPTWRIKETSRHLTPGNQCRLCLMVYRMGDQVRRLPDCNHIFHAACIDPWLLHRRPTCPLDAIGVETPLPPERSMVRTASSQPASITTSSNDRRANTGSNNAQRHSNQPAPVLNMSGFSLSGTGFPRSSNTSDLRDDTNSANNLHHVSVSSSSLRPRNLPPLSSPLNMTPVDNDIFTHNNVSHMNVDSSNINGQEPRPLRRQNSSPHVQTMPHNHSGRKRGSKLNRNENNVSDTSLQIQPSAPSIPTNYHQNNASFNLGVGVVSASNASLPPYHPVQSRPTRRLQTTPGHSFGPPGRLRARSASESRKQREREKSYANDPRLQEAQRKLELYAHSYNINIQQ